MPKGSARCRANQAYTAFHHGEGVWGFGKDAETERPKALQAQSPQSVLIGIENLLYFYKKRLFLQTEPPTSQPAVCITHIFYQLSSNT